MSYTAPRYAEKHAHNPALTETQRRLKGMAIVGLTRVALTTRAG
jgi:hypothetical protein